MNVGVGIVVDDVPDVAMEVEVDPGLVLDLESVPDLVAAPEVARLRSRSRSPTPAVLCGVCREKVPSHVLLRCGHALCGICLGQLERHQDDRCPFCRAFIEMSFVFKYLVGVLVPIQLSLWLKILAEQQPPTGAAAGISHIVPGHVVYH
ncbi:postreplication repair E3 ubiquitin-protein ligase RAD18-like [Hyposmocoma kahamanoa]|uniref:postreplication repair E3 ubiquitin-protein ligase RAD18-like n=1 Tax=Hyposmocoma kahamanoa TaxID=1477025 RepID=UPI000E6D74F8|nr:postreplication repair E3 ubiquitin-protein ligase RAD18-like [Hyposmocoma kahamanoa]